MSEATAVTSTAVHYEIDPSHSAAHFTVRHMMITNVRGELGKVTGTLLLDTADLTRSTASATIETAGINTRDAKRDEHLRSPDFLDVASFPAITFKSKKVASKGADELAVTGDLTIRGVTREVTLAVEGPTGEVKTPWGGYKIGATATVKLSRKEFGLVWNMALEAGGLAVADSVTVTLELEFDRK